MEPLRPGRMTSGSGTVGTSVCRGAATGFPLMIQASNAAMSSGGFLMGQASAAQYCSR